MVNNFDCCFSFAGLILGRNKIDLAAPKCGNSRLLLQRRFQLPSDGSTIGAYKTILLNITVFLFSFITILFGLAVAIYPAGKKFF